MGKLLDKLKSKKLPEGQLSEHFHEDEFRCHGTGALPPGGMAPKLIDLLEELRAHFGQSVVINSGYRSESHNKSVGGATNSQHIKGTAADVVVSRVSPAEVYKWANINNPAGGVGKYNSFTHIDVRDGKARW